MVWTANRDYPPVSSNATIELTVNGTLTINADIGEIVIADPPEPATFATMQDYGNFVIYGESSNAIWESFSFPTDTILGGQKLSAEKELLSKASPSDFSTGRFCLKMQSDGNLVAYPSKIIPKTTDYYWSTGTSGSVYLHLDNDGALKLEDGSNSSMIKQLNKNYSGDTLMTIYHATLDPDGNLRVYRNTSTIPLWEVFNDTCAVKSFCGYNSYCTSRDNQPWCYCVPGTDVINYSENYNGCQRNFTKQKCRDGMADTRFYYMTKMEKVKWEDVPYFNGFMSEEDCKNSCLEDCDCDAAEYDSTTTAINISFP